MYKNKKKIRLRNKGTKIFPSFTLSSFLPVSRARISIIYSKISTTMIIEIQAESIVSDTNEFINFWLQSLVTQGERERQFLKAYFN